MALYSQALILFLIVLSSSGVFTASLKQNKYDSDEEEQINLLVKKVHIIFMNHLDAGFTDYIDNVINLYFTQYFTQAVQRAAELAEGDYVETFRYTTHPWLVSMYLDCPKHIHLLPGDKVKCPSAEDIEVFTQAVKLGFITWHAGPMNMQYEFLDGALLAHAFNLTLSLDARFNITRKYRTLSQRDVPGMTQAVIPVLVKQGIAAITVGVNAATSPPAVPRIFNWEYNGQSVLAMWHPGGYPNNPGRNPKSPGGLSAKDCVTVGGFDEAMCFAFRSDNQGPPQSMEEIFGYYEILRRQFPNAKLGASSLEDFTAAVMSANIKLPTIRNEIGDTWIQGIQSDPRKVAEMRAVMRGRAECIQNGMCSYEDPRFFNSSRLLLKTGEHTWGYHGLSDQINWGNTAFQTVKNSTEFKNNTLGWMAQRQFTYLAVDALSDHPLAENITKEFDDMKPSKPDLTDYHSDTILLYKCPNGIQVGFDETTGSLNQVADPLKQIEWASDTNGLAKFHYNTYNQTDFDAMQTAYINDGWFDLGIDKPNITQNAHPESKVWEPTLAEFYRKKGDSDCDFYAHLKMKDAETATKYGAPSEIWVHYQVTDYKLDRMGIDITIQWFDKPATRMPEGIFLSFEPTLQDGYGWMMSKSGQMIDPMNVVLNGSQRLHAIDRGVSYTDKDGNGIEFTSKDVALVSTITKTLPGTALPLPLHQTDTITGVSYNLFNNLWNLNYVLWYPFSKGDEDFKARFSINLLHQKLKAWPKISASRSYTEGTKFERL